MLLTIGLLILTSNLLTIRGGMRKLTEEENEKLQKECGISDFDGIIRSQHFKSIYGTDARIGDFPWAVKIFSVMPDMLATACTGSLISPWHILTASHCVTSKKIFTNMILAGTTCIYDMVKNFIPNAAKCNSTVKANLLIGKNFIVPKASIGYQVLNSIENPEQFAVFLRSTVFADIAIIELSKSINSNSLMRPICLPSGTVNEPPEGELAIAYGYGTTEKRGLENEMNSKLKWVIMKKCNLTLQEHPSLLISRNILQYCSEFTQYPCHGDSGGGLEKIVGTRHIIVGVTSQISFNTPHFATNCMPNNYDDELRNLPAYFSNVETLRELICHYTGVCPDGYHVNNSFDGIGALHGSLSQETFKAILKKRHPKVVETATTIYSKTHPVKRTTLMKSTKVPLWKASDNYFDHGLLEEQQLMEVPPVYGQVPQQPSSYSCDTSFDSRITLFAVIYVLVFIISNMM